MTTTFTATVRRGTLVPREPFDLPEGSTVEVSVNHLEKPSEAKRTQVSAKASAVTDSSNEQRSPLMRLYHILRDMPSDPDSPADAAAEHDHYLYGTPKRGDV